MTRDGKQSALQMFSEESVMSLKSDISVCNDFKVIEMILTILFAHMSMNEGVKQFNFCSCAKIRVSKGKA